MTQPLDIVAEAKAAWFRKEYSHIEEDPIGKYKRIANAQQKFIREYLNLILPPEYQAALEIKLAEEEEFMSMYCSFEWAGETYYIQKRNLEPRFMDSDLWSDGVLLSPANLDEDEDDDGDILPSSPYEKNFVPGEFLENFLAWLGQKLD